jgi:hypothetical protein
LDHIREATRKKRPPFSSDRLYLVNVNSPTERAKVYAEAARALQCVEERVLPEYGGRPWKVRVTLDDPPNHVQPWFVFSKRGRLELATWPYWLEKIPDPPKWPGYYASTSHVYDADDSDDDDEPVKKTTVAASVDVDDSMRAVMDLQDRTMTEVSEFACTEKWRYPLLTITWTSPLRITFRTRKSAWDHAVQLCKNQVTMDKQLHGIGANGKLIKLVKCTKKAAFQAGKLRFEKDGLWVVGQEDEWRLERLRDEQRGTAEHFGSQKVAKSVLAYYLQCNRQQYKEKRLRELETASACRVSEEKKDSVAGPVAENMTAAYFDIEDAKKGQSDIDSKRIVENRDTEKADKDSDPIAIEDVISPEQIETCKEKMSFTLREAETQLRHVWKTLSDQEYKEWEERFTAYKIENNMIDLDTIPTSDSATLSPKPERAHKEADSDGVKYAASYSASHGQSACPISPSPELGQQGSSNEENIAHSSTKTNRKESSKSGNCKLDETDTLDAFELPLGAEKYVETKAWRLNDEQIKLCYDAGIEHYDQIMRTVQAKDLTRELQDGFDLFRERGRGRYDMELPVFDEPQFSFLTHLKNAPWMPIVREILGKDVVLIHKGMFLSMPGAAAQFYHQDGVHLTGQYQKPCHAINVFIPLIDMTMLHGPTEFCLGSHILGQDELNNDFLYTPVVKKGTPIMFDYRLGHRGLANKSDACRPIVYCTYARTCDGKEFRDSVNFSRKRYHAIGEIVDKKPSRDERAKRRKLQSGWDDPNVSHDDVAQSLSTLAVGAKSD